MARENNLQTVCIQAGGIFGAVAGGVAGFHHHWWLGVAGIPLGFIAGVLIGLCLAWLVYGPLILLIMVMERFHKK